MTCYTFSVRPTIPESENFKISMKKISEEENEDFCEEEYFNFEELSLGEEETFWYIKLENVSAKFQIVQFIADNLKKTRNKKVNYPLKLSNLKKDDVILQLYKRFYQF